jgi:DNA-binding beta-propeller fold protein YncE
MLAACAATRAGPPEYRVTTRLAVAGPERWDYVFVDQRSHRLYVAHSTQTDVIDTTTDKLIGTIADTHGVHGIAVAHEPGLVFTSNGADGEIGVYDLKTLQKVRAIKAGTNPDAIVFEPKSRRVIAFNGRSHDITIADAASGSVVGAPLAAGGKPEFAVIGSDGLVYFNIEDTAEIGVLDAGHAKLVRRYSIAPCESPTGLDIDPEGRLYSVCDNGMMVVSDPGRAKVIGQAAIGAGPDGVVWLDGYAISANGRDGTASVIAEPVSGRFETLTTVTVAPGARTIAADHDLHKLYLPTADFRPAAPPAPGQKAARPEAIAGSFKVIVLTAH